MRFSPDGYYVESYVKCVNCGVLVYDAGTPGRRGTKPAMFCSAWCREWDALREAGVENPVLKLE